MALPNSHVSGGGGKRKEASPGAARRGQESQLFVAPRSFHAAEKLENIEIPIIILVHQHLLFVYLYLVFFLNHFPSLFKPRLRFSTGRSLDLKTVCFV